MNKSNLFQTCTFFFVFALIVIFNQNKYSIIVVFDSIFLIILFNK